LTKTTTEVMGRGADGDVVGVVFEDVDVVGNGGAGWSRRKHKV
jgi:hypothetical protein